MPPTLLSPNQLNTAELFSVKQILLSRGYVVSKEEDKSKLLITEENKYDPIWAKMFEVFQNRKLRVELKDFLYKGKPIKSKEVVEITEHSKFVKEFSRFDNTFEWYAGELMVKKFAAFSHSNGVTVNNIMRNSTSTSSGDYDSLVVLRDMKLAYFECKAGSFDGEKIMKCYERMLSLNCEYSILICNEDIKEEDIKWYSSKVQVPITKMHELKKINIKETNDIVYDLHNCYIMDLSGDIENKIRTVIRVNAAKTNQIHYIVGMDDETFSFLGYESSTLQTTRY